MSKEEKKEKKERRIGNKWIGVDLDGTLAFDEGWKGHQHIGPPIPLMLERVKRWLAMDIEVRIFTARASANWVPPVDADSKKGTNTDST